MMIIVDYKSTTLKTNPSIGVARKVSWMLSSEQSANALKFGITGLGGPTATLCRTPGSCDRRKFTRNFELFLQGH
jgi:hypothetical protein